MLVLFKKKALNTAKKLSYIQKLLGKFVFTFDLFENLKKNYKKLLLLVPNTRKLNHKITQ